MSRTIRISNTTWERLQSLATPFRPSERGTPDRVIQYVLDRHDKKCLPPARHSCERWGRERA